MEIIETRVYRNRPPKFLVDVGDGPVLLTRQELDAATPSEYTAYEPPDDEEE